MHWLECAETRRGRLDGVRVTGSGIPQVFWGRRRRAPCRRIAASWSGNLSAPAGGRTASLRRPTTSGRQDTIGLRDRSVECDRDASTPLTGRHPAPLSRRQRHPRDLDGDGLYEDVNGNGRADFADVVVLFNQIDWVNRKPIIAFDFSGNGRIDCRCRPTLRATLGIRWGSPWMPAIPPRLIHPPLSPSIAAIAHTHSVCGRGSISSGVST